MKKSFMKRLVALALVIVSVCSMSAVAFAAGNKYVKLQNGANFRAEPNEDSKRLAIIPYNGGMGYQDSVTGDDGQSWSCVTFAGQEGYVLTSALTDTPTNTHPTSPVQAFGSETLEKGHKGYFVVNVQLVLKELGYLDDVADGIFGKNTKAAVEEFQTAMELKVDGKVGENTRTKLWNVYGWWLVQNGVMIY